MNSRIKYNEEQTPTSFVVYANRTTWYFSLNGGTATFSRVEVDKDDHSTDDAVVLFGSEWTECMEYVKGLPTVEDIAVEEPINL